MAQPSKYSSEPAVRLEKPLTIYSPLRKRRNRLLIESLSKDVDSIILSMRNYHDSIFKNGDPDNEARFRRLQYAAQNLEESKHWLKKIDNSAVSFLLGFHYQQMAFHTDRENEAKSLLIKSCSNYQSRVKYRRGISESYYYSQLQIALLQQSLNHPWFETQQSFLKAYTIDPIRGESIKEIIKHYVFLEHWPHAYIFSSFSKAHFFDRNPCSKRKWVVDHAFYNWKVLNYHAVICCHLGKWNEAKSTSDLLLQRIGQHPDYFSQQDVEIIRNNAKILQRTV